MGNNEFGQLDPSSNVKTICSLTNIDTNSNNNARFWATGNCTILQDNNGNVTVRGAVGNDFDWPKNISSIQSELKEYLY